MDRRQWSKVRATEVYWHPSGRDVIGDLRMEQVNKADQWNREDEEFMN